MNHTKGDLKDKPNMICADDEFVIAIFAIKGHSIDRSTATYRAAGHNLEKTLKFLDWVTEKRKQDALDFARLELRKQRHLKVQQVTDQGYKDRSAYLALSKNSWDVPLTMEYLESEREEREEKKQNNKTRENMKNEDTMKDKKKKQKDKSRSSARNENNETHLDEVEISEYLLDSLEQQTHMNKSTCKRVYMQCAGDVSAAVLQLQQLKDNSNQRIMRSEKKRKARKDREEKLSKLMVLTGYEREKCEKIFAFFGYDYVKAECKYKKFLHKKQGGEKLNIENEENNVLMEFRIEELELAERRDLEQYFFSRDTLVELIKVIEKFDNPCCMVCPSVAHATHYLNRELTLLDIDDRFSYLPRYMKYNLYEPSPLTQNFDLILFDPPYFQIPMTDLVHSVDVVSNYNSKTALIIAFLKRSELQLLRSFNKYQLRATKYHPGYANVKLNKQKNYLFYSNWDGLPNNGHLF